MPYNDNDNENGGGGGGSAASYPTRPRPASPPGRQRQQQQQQHRAFWGGGPPTTTAPVQKNLSTTTTTTGTANESPQPAEKKMTTSDLCKIVAEQHDLSQAESKRILATVFDTVADALSKRQQVSVAHFGKFDTYRRKPYKGVNPNTGESMDIPASDRVRFRPYDALKRAVVVAAAAAGTGGEEGE